MRYCLIVFLTLIWLPIALFSIWNANFYLTAGKSDFWLKNFSQIKGPERLSQQLPGLFGLVIGKEMPSQATTALQGIVEKSFTPRGIEKQLGGLLSGGEKFLKGQTSSLPGLDLGELRQTILSEPTLPSNLKQSFLGEIPQQLSLFKQQPPQKILNWVKLPYLSWIISLVVSSVLLILIVLLARGLRGKLLTAGILLALASGLILASLPLFSWTKSFAVSWINNFNFQVPGPASAETGLGKLVGDLLDRVFRNIGSLKLAEGLVGLGGGIILFIVSLFVPGQPKVSPAPESIATKNPRQKLGS